MTVHANDYRIIQAIVKENGLFTKRKILDTYPDFDKRDVDRVIREMCAGGKLCRFGTGRSTCYQVCG